MQLVASCLCGANRFALEGAGQGIIACHCSQCRKTSGHYAASLDVAGIRWQARAAVGEYASAGGGTRGFCTSCGSSLYFRAPDGAISVEAGAIDGPTGRKLSAHIYCANTGDYYRIPANETQFSGAGHV
tara:strand:+ start:359 stop:745 length:387 start_codon:yes stop_codon:yes gene_type:complete